MNIKNILFDFGGVLVDWNPRYMYRKHFSNEKEMEDFLQTVQVDAWHSEQDRGRSLAEGTRVLQNQFPEYHDLIELFYKNWDEMFRGEITGTVEILHKVKDRYKIYGLTNWSAEVFPSAYLKFPFFSEFDGIVVSGVEKLIKPNPEIFYVTLNRFDIKPDETLFIDDNLNNINAAKALGIHAIHFQNAEKLYQELQQLNII